MEDVDKIEKQFVQFMEEQNKARNYDLMMMVFTNVEGNGSRFLYVGKLSQSVSAAISKFSDNGYVSRKKQIVPSLAAALI